MIVPLFILVQMLVQVQPQEPKKISQCKVAKATRAAPSKNDSIQAWVTVDGLEIQYRLQAKQGRYTVVSGPILDPVFDTSASRFLWIAMEEVCDLDLVSGKASQVYREVGLSGIGRMSLRGKTVVIQGADRTKCMRLEFRKKKYLVLKSPCIDSSRL